MFSYLFESGICLAVFYLIYRVFFKKETYFHLIRYYLLFSLVASSIIPLISIQLIDSRDFIIPTLHLSPIVQSDLPIESTNTDGFETVQRSFGFYIQSILFIVYLTGVCVFTIKTLAGLFYLASIVRWTSGKNQNKIILHNKNIPPFSFFNYIFLQSDCFNEDEIHQIIEHERTHKNLLHSFDVLFVELLAALHWINPFIWLIRNSIKENHEHFVDRRMIETGIQREQYFKLILSLSDNNKMLPATNSIVNPDIKNRIRMTSKQKSRPISTTKLLVVVPFLICMLYAFSNSPTLNPDDSSQDELVTVPANYSPSGNSGIFKIDGITAYPKNEIAIYNKFGDKVVSFEGYDNSWDGKIGVEKDKYLPTDVYIYSVKLDDDITRITGSILIFQPGDGIGVSCATNGKSATICFPKDRHVIVHATMSEDKFLILLDGEKITSRQLQIMASSEISDSCGVYKAELLETDYDLTDINWVFMLQRE